MTVTRTRLGFVSASKSAPSVACCAREYIFPVSHLISGGDSPKGWIRIGFDLIPADRRRNATPNQSKSCARVMAVTYNLRRVDQDHDILAILGAIFASATGPMAKRTFDAPIATGNPPESGAMLNGEPR